MYSDRSHNRISLRIDDCDVVRAGIDNINFVLCRIGGNPGWLTSHAYRLHRLKRAQIDHADGIALAVGDVGVFAICGTVVGKRTLMEIPPPDRDRDGGENGDEEELSQGNDGEVVLIKFKVNLYLDPHSNWFAVFLCGFELPLLHGFDRLRVELRIKRLINLYVMSQSIRSNHHL